MFKNPGSKIINVAAIFFALQILGLIGLTVYIVIAGAWLALIAVAIYAFMAWWSTVQLLALAEAAEESRHAAVQATDAVSKLRQVLEALETEDMNALPTWKRLELERMRKQ